MPRLTPFPRRPSAGVAPVALLVVTVALLFATTHAQETPALFTGISPTTGLLLRDEVVTTLIQHSSGDLARDTVARLSLWDRTQVTEGYGRAAAWIAERAKEAGLQQVAIERFASDGTAQYFASGTERRWTVKKGELWITAPVSLKLTSYDEMPLSLCRNSTTARVETELVDVGEGMADADYSADVKGKIVLASGIPAMVVNQAVGKRGAAGVISSWSVPVFDTQNRLPGDHPEQVGVAGIPPAAPAGAPGRFAFLISARRAQEVKTLMKRGPVRIRADVDASLSAGTLDVVSATIPGTKYADEEVVISAHLDHYKPGANDNASGSGAILEMARTLAALIDAKILPPPLRTIRFMWVPEYSGTRAWFATHLNDATKRVAELNFDMVGENVKTTNAVFAVSYLPDSRPSFLNALTAAITEFLNTANDDRYSRRPELQVLSLTGSRDRTSIRMTPYMTGTDHELFNQAGIPGTTLGVFPDDHYHSSTDSIEQVDATQLHRATVFGLLGAVTLAYADEAQAGDLAWLALVHGRQRAAAAESELLRGLAGASKEGFAAADARARLVVPHVYRRERASVSSCAVFAKTAEAKRRVERLAALLDEDQPAASRRIDAAAAFRAAEVGAVRGAAPRGEAERRAARLVPAWERGSELTSLGAAASRAFGGPGTQPPEALNTGMAAAVREMRARGDSELRIMGLSNAPATWVDGTRSILDISNAMAAEYAAIPLDALEAYFRVFEKAGAMKIVER